MTYSQIRLALQWILEDYSLRLMHVEASNADEWRVTIFEGLDRSERVYRSWDEFYNHCEISNRIVDGTFVRISNHNGDEEMQMELQHILDEFVQGVNDSTYAEHLASLQQVWLAEVHEWLPEKSQSGLTGQVVYLPSKPAEPYHIWRGADGLWRLWKATN